MRECLTGSRTGAAHAVGDPARSRSLRCIDERGSVTAEFAVVTPAIVVVLAVCLAVLQLSVQQLRVHDAAWQAARAQARGAPLPPAVAQLGAHVMFEQRDRSVCAVVEASATGVLAVLGAVTLTAVACAPEQRL